MTGRVDFYVLDSATVRQRWLFACRLVEKAYLEGRRVLLLAGSAEDAAGLDDLLWTFDERSFVPHELCGAPEADPQTPVQLAVDAATAPPADLLVNLSGRLPPALERFERVAEIVDADSAWRSLGRERFKAYRELKLPLNTHQPGGAGDL
jgi:DNA polymerase-3 subunit chi